MRINLLILFYFLSNSLVFCQQKLTSVDYEQIAINVTFSAYSEGIIDKSNCRFVTCYNDTSIVISEKYSNDNSLIQIKIKGKETISDISLLITNIIEISENKYSVHFTTRCKTCTHREYNGYFTVINKEKNYRVIDSWYTKTIY